MKERGIIKRFIVVIVALSLSLVLLWVGFYFITERIIQHNMRLQAETASEALIDEVEDELLRLEDISYTLSHDEKVAAAVRKPTVAGFFESAEKYSDELGLILPNTGDIDDVVLFTKDGSFYRLKGKISNTTLKKAFSLISTEGNRTFTVTYNNNSYIGTYAAIGEPGTPDGYVVLLTEETRLERMLGMFNDIDYLDVALLAGDRLLCSNKGLSEADIGDMKDVAFVREKNIGLSSFRLLVFCREDISKNLAMYFRIALPVTVLILIVVIFFFSGYLRRHMLEPINTVIANTRTDNAKPLAHTGEEYFDGLVDHVNEMMVRIEEKEHALYESEARAREADLEKERTLISLLKKQINAHFTVNTLNVVRALVNKGEKEEAAHICDELSTLLRYANAAEEHISLMEEFFVLEQYVGIMQARYQGRIEADFEMDDAYADVYIPRMLIQPIIENAIVHGFVGREGKITVSAQISEKGTVICVKDNGVGMSPAALSELRESIYGNDSDSASSGLHHVALRNIQHRIRMVCGPEYGLTIESAQGEGTTVYVHLP